ncbi:MAG: ATP-binding cassette domain-containing protein [Phenylobacterium sp.]|uniref:ABC transporter ATP-binding protein n=1 Tax=Phenylobacterium sp. TaxID=1871053 RepID=UPI003918758E
MAQIIAEGLSKTYRVAERDPGLIGAARGLFVRRHREIEALRGVSFALQAGELLGFIGPNGAGKSTTIKILSGILTPTSGRCEIEGLTPWRDRIRHVAHIGVVFGQRSQLWWDLPVVEGFDLLAAIYRLDPADYRRTLDRMVGLMRLERLLDQPVRQLSLGQRMRCEIAAALLHRPRILFLDEPTIGLDATTKLAVRDIVRTLNREEGVTVLLTTHDMHDIQALAERVVVIGHGRILADTSIGAMRAQILSERRLHVRFGGPAPRLDFEGTEVRACEDDRLELAFDPQRTPAAALIARISAAHAVADIHVEEPLIEEVIARFYDLHDAQEA